MDACMDDTGTAMECSVDTLEQQVCEHPGMPPRKMPRTDLIELARQIETADDFIKANVSNKLTVIAEQVQFLQKQAYRILEEAQLNTRLHHAACNFKKVPGSVYYLYKRPNGQEYFSMIKPEEWGPQCPHEFLGGYRLESDFTWTPTEAIEKKNRQLDAISRISQFSCWKQEPMAIADAFVQK
ncbi:hypothetical protein MTO96_002881 [Rhipicephalus appendiculatus]|uniref:Uncharacterized protein n=2 Tax=Rhipicephalus TaxID=426455 RepID=A0A131YJR1_RHIAP